MEMEAERDKENQNESSNNSCCHVNKAMIRFKVHYFLFYGAIGMVIPYLPLIAKNRLGLLSTSYAAVMTTVRILTTVSKPVIGFIADYFNRIKLMINILLFVQIVCYFLILAIPSKSEVITTHSQPNSLNHVMNNSKSGGNLIFFKKHAQNVEYFSHQNDLSNTEENKGYLNDDKNEINMTCVTMCDIPEMACSQNGFFEENNETIFETEMDGYCSIVQVEQKCINESTIFLGKNYFILSSISANFSFQNLNSSSMCSVKLSKNKSLSHSSNDFVSYVFWIFALLILISGTCISGLFNLADTMCNEIVHKYKADFGRQTIFSTIGFGSFALVTGVLFNVTNDYLVAWLIMALLSILCSWNISKLDLVKTQFSKSILKDVGTIFKSPEFLIFVLGVFMNGLCAGLLWYYLFWFLTNLGANAFLCGLVQYVQCFSVIPFQFFSGWFIKKIGHLNLLSVSLASFAVRFMWYSYLQNPWLVFPVEILQSFTHGTFYPTVATYGKLSAKPGTEATTLSILFGTHEGIGKGLGCVIAGITFEYLGSHRTFFYFSIFGFIGLCLNIINTIILHRRNSKISKSLSTES